jgi:hypothetical protein
MSRKYSSFAGINYIIYQKREPVKPSFSELE